MKRSARSARIEPLGVVLQRDTDLRVPTAASQSRKAMGDVSIAGGTRRVVSC